MAIFAVAGSLARTLQHAEYRNPKRDVVKRHHAGFGYQWWRFDSSHPDPARHMGERRAPTGLQNRERGFDSLHPCQAGCPWEARGGCNPPASAMEVRFLQPAPQYGAVQSGYTICANDASPDLVARSSLIDGIRLRNGR